MPVRLLELIHWISRKSLLTCAAPQMVDDVLPQFIEATKTGGLRSECQRERWRNWPVFEFISTLSR